MYESHFQLRRRPFAATPDPVCHYLSPSQAPLVQSVARCIDLGQGIAIATGPAGIGKTLLAQVLLAESESRFAGVYLGTGQFPTRRALLQAILYELGQSYGGMTDQELRLELNTALRNLITQKDALLLILDEAHLLSDRLLEEVRLLADLAQYGVPLTRVVLSGNPEFEERLTSPALAAFNQRVACHIVLEQFTRAESVEYLAHRIEWAGGQLDQIFERDALQLIADASDGIPRCLNQLADRSLTQAFLSGLRIVSEELVRQTLAELQHLPLRWNASALRDRSRQMTAAIEPPVVERPTSIVTESAIEIGEETEASTCCFEFGAGDTESNHVSHIEVETIPAAEVHVVHSAAADEIATYAISSHVESVEPEAEDGPPLFPWLARTESEATVDSKAAETDFSTSSFTIRARRRERPQPIEQEVVSTLTLSGAELQPKRRAEQPKAASIPQRKEVSWDAELPAEEVVIDQYATLDARQAPMFPLPRVDFLQPSRTDESFAEQAELEVFELPAGAIDRGATDPDINPLERIDSISDLLHSDERPIAVNGGVELITEYGVEWVDVDLSAHAEIPGTSPAAPQLSADPEAWIGSTVVEIGRDLQQAMGETSPKMVDRKRSAKIEQLLDSIERETHFDIVEPDPVEPLSPPAVESHSYFEDEAADQVRVVPPPNHSYKNFFSALRRRQAR